MPKSRTRRRNKPRPQTKKQPSPKQRWKNSLPLLKRLTIRTWALIGGIGIVIGIASGLLTFASRVSVSSSSALKPSDPFSTPFIVSNDGLFAIYDVIFTCSIKEVAMPNDISFSDSSFGSAIPITVIESGEKATTECRIAFPDATSKNSADISIVTSYQPRFLPYRVEKPYRFKMRQGTDKQWYWLPQPVAK